MGKKMKTKQPKSNLRKIADISIGISSMVTAFLGWGYIMSYTQSPHSAEAAHLDGSRSISLSNETDTEREALLSKAKSAKPKSGESNVIFNDPFIQNKWGLERTNALKAWEITQGSKDIVVAVIDTGIDANHRDLSENLWINPGESGLDSKGRNKATNGVDDDNNGFTDDINGWNFVHNNNQLTDNHGHGTHIAGIVGARGGNSFGISGVAPQVSLMVLKYYDPKSSSSNNLKNTVQAIRYAIQQKANIINYSGGGVDYSAEEFAAVKEAERAGILFVAAAGNERSNSDEAGKHYYPADYELSNIISVTAVNKKDTKVLASSNYGVRTVDLAAPGEDIYSALPGNNFGLMTGTSQATAFVTGVAALVMAHNREFNAADVKKYILRTGDEYPSLLSKTGTAKLLNSYKALTSLDQGVGLSGVIATNTAKVGKKAFLSNQNIKNPNLNTSVLKTSADDGEEEPAETIALFGKEMIQAIQDAKSPTARPELRSR